MAKYCTLCGIKLTQYELADHIYAGIFEDKYLCYECINKSNKELKRNIMKGYVLGFLFSQDKKHVALILKNKPEWQAGHFNGIGGKIEDGETPLQAMIREFKEEADYTCTEWREFANMKNSQFIVHCFVGYSDGKQQLTSLTDERVMRVLVNDVYTNEYKTIPNLKWLIAMALDDGFELVTINYLEADKYKEDGNN